MEMGGLNVICNNAGIACPLDERARWEEVLAINLVKRLFHDYCHDQQIIIVAALVLFLSKRKYANI